MIAKKESLLNIFLNKILLRFLTTLICCEADKDYMNADTKDYTPNFIAFILQNLDEIEGLQCIEETDRQLVSQLLADWNRFRSQQLQQQQTKTAQVANAPAASSNAAPLPAPVGSQMKPRAMGMFQTARYHIFRAVLCIRIRIGSGFNGVSGSVSGSRRAKENIGKSNKLHFLKCWMFFFEG